jgi:chloramphenicol-sensitive protein RarD
VAAIDALGGLLVETMLLAPFCAIVLLVAARSGHGAFGPSASLNLLLILAGAATTVPLLMFAAAARRMQYATLGLLQYIAPTLQFGEAVLLFGEPLHPAHLMSFALIWTGLAIYATDSLRASRAMRLAAAE